MSGAEGFAPSRPGRAAAAWLRVYRALGRATHPTFTVGAMVIVRRPNGELLLVRHRFRTPSQWGFPGGFCRAREQPWQAATRELSEEVGLRLTLGPDDQVAHYVQPWARHVESVFTVVHDEAAPARRRSFEITEVRWAHPDRLPPLTREAALALQTARERGRLPRPG